MNIEHYYFCKRASLAERTKDKRIIFLDTKYWLYLRDASLGRGGEKKQKLLALVREAFNSGQFLFPVSGDVLIEVWSQSDPVTLYETVDLIDELSSGLCLITEDERRELEFLNEIRLNGGFEKLESNAHVWTTFSFHHGLRLPSDIDKDFEQQKYHIDRMWNKSLRFIVETMGYGKTRVFPKFPDLSGELNTEKQKQIESYESWREIYLSELANILDECSSIPATLEIAGLISLSKKTNGGSGTDLFKHTCDSIFDNLFAGKAKPHYPAFHIPAAIMASVCWDTKRKFKRTDWLDFKHATAAIPYCDIFLTENSLCQLANRKDVEFNVDYDCCILSDLSKACERMELEISKKS